LKVEGKNTFIRTYLNEECIDVYFYSVLTFSKGLGLANVHINICMYWEQGSRFGLYRSGWNSPNSTATFPLCAMWTPEQGLENYTFLHFWHRVCK
jgi:hypothetical protein